MRKKITIKSSDNELSNNEELINDKAKKLINFDTKIKKNSEFYLINEPEPDLRNS
jgi:hypothetical protein